MLISNMIFQKSHIYICCSCTQIQKIVRLTSFQRLNGVITQADFQYDIFNNPYEVRSAEHERTNVAKQPLRERLEGLVYYIITL